MKEYYRNGSITVYHGDCMDLLDATPDKAYDLAIVDPPYGINEPNMNMGHNPTRKGGKQGISAAVLLRKGRLNSGGGKLKTRALNTMNCNWDTIAPGPEYFNTLTQKSKNQIIWGGNYFDLPPTRGIVCWDKRQPWLNFSQWEMAWTSFDSPAKLFQLGNTNKKIHPTQKPCDLYKFLLHTYAKQGNTILDTHGGSLSIAIACHDLGYNLTVIEKDEKYLELAVKRLAEHQSQLRIAI
jgi:site-specific DNA-methyltransferase (adenine-specific)